MRLMSFMKDGRESFGIATDRGVIDAGRRLQSARTSARRAARGLAARAAPAGEREARLSARGRRVPAARSRLMQAALRRHQLCAAHEGNGSRAARVSGRVRTLGRQHRRPRAADDPAERLSAIRLRRRARGRDRPPRAAREPRGCARLCRGLRGFNDGSVRDYQRHSQQFTPGKNFHASGSFGPWLVTADEVPDIAQLRLTTQVERRSGARRERRGD